MESYVVDTNVPVVANGRSQQADAACVIACVNLLEKVYNGGRLVLDAELRILTEYMSNLSMSGQPGAGDLFMKWAWQVQADESRCERVPLTVRGGRENDFDRVPVGSGLEKFDRSDLKFVAVALGSRFRPRIVNAVDSDWANHYRPLADLGLRIEFICPQHVRP